MKNKKSTVIIVSISIFVGLLHFVIGPDYQGIFRHFIRGYLIDIVLPMNLYLLLQISLRKTLSVNKARIIGAIIPRSYAIVTRSLTARFPRSSRYSAGSRVWLYKQIFSQLPDKCYGLCGRMRITIRIVVKTFFPPILLPLFRYRYVF
jgi:hypothetical protein